MKLLVALVGALAVVAVALAPKTNATFTAPNFFAASSATPASSASLTPGTSASPSSSPSAAPTVAPTPPPVTKTNPPAPPPNPRTKSISGTVITSAGSVVSGVTIVVYRADDGVPVYWAATNSSGFYYVPVVPNINYKVLATGGRVFDKWYANAESFGAANVLRPTTYDLSGINIVVVTH